jgi:hypothetical protein
MNFEPVATQDRKTDWHGGLNWLVGDGPLVAEQLYPVLRHLASELRSGSILHSLGWTGGVAGILAAEARLAGLTFDA